MKDYAFNMRETDGSEHKESVVETLLNSAAKSLQEMYFETFKIKFNRFEDIEFQEARDSKKRFFKKSLRKKKQVPSYLLQKNK